MLALALSLTSDLAQVAGARQRRGFDPGAFGRAGWPGISCHRLETVAFTGLYVIVPNRPVPGATG